VGRKVFVHNGKLLIPFWVTKEKVGHRFGEFVCTKRIGRSIHKPRQKGGSSKQVTKGRAGKK
jgi:ribosomal protein S19